MFIKFIKTQLKVNYFSTKLGRWEISSEKVLQQYKYINYYDNSLCIKPKLKVCEFNIISNFNIGYCKKCNMLTNSNNLYKITSNLGILENNKQICKNYS